VTALGLLLLLQALAFLGIGTLQLLSASLQLGITPDTVIRELPHALRGTLFMALALLALLASISFLRLRRAAWVSAMLVQGLSLLLALGVYLRDHPGSRLYHYSYLMMIYGLFMVVYLNYEPVQAAFRARPETPEPRRP
jgi:hypothetical protein